MSNIFQFGEKVQGYETNVINEREARASAGIIMILALLGFSFVAFKQNFYYTEMFSFAFLIEFSIRMFINPKYAPFMILGRMFIFNQKPEYVGAPQKRFAWGIGFILGLIMVTLIIYNNTGDERVLVCILCLTFLFLESVFGICVGCKLYEFFTRNKAQNCPGGACEMRGPKADVQKISYIQIFILVVFLSAFYNSNPIFEDRIYAHELTFEEMEAMEENTNSFDEDDEDDEDI